MYPEERQQAIVALVTQRRRASVNELALGLIALQAGADLFLTKPFSPLHLLRLVDRIGATG